MHLMRSLNGLVPARMRRLLSSDSVTTMLLAFAVKVAGAALSFCFSLLVARMFGASGAGAYALALTTATLASTVALLGLDFLLLRGIARALKLGAPARARGLVDGATVIVLASAGAMAAAMVAMGDPLVQLLGGSGMSRQMLILTGVAVLPLALLRITIASLRSAGQPVVAQMLDGPLGALLALAGIGVTLMLGALPDVAGVFGFYLAGVTVAMLAGVVRFRRAARGWPAAQWQSRRAMVSESWRLSLIVLSMWLADWLLLVLVNQRFSTLEVGQFRTAWQIVSLVNLVVVSFDSVVGPQVSAASSVRDLSAIMRLWRQSIAVMALLSAPLFLLMLAVPEWLLGLFGREFVAAAPALRILALGQLVNILTGPIGSMITMTGHERWSLRMSGLSVLLVVLVGAVAVPALGVAGAAITSAVNVAFRSLFSLYVLLRVVVPTLSRP